MGIIQAIFAKKCDLVKKIAKSLSRTDSAAPAYNVLRTEEGFGTMQRVRKMVAGEVPEGTDGRGVTVAVLDTGDCVIVLPD